MSEQKPEAVWIFPEEKKRRGGRIALVIGLVVAALIAAAVVALFLIPHGPGPVATPTPSASTPATLGPTVSPSASAEPTIAPTTGPTTPPPVPDPSIDQFRDQVGFRLTTADQGLDMIASGNDAGATVAKLQGDAQRLLDTPAPSSIEQKWRDALQTYAVHLNDLAGDPSNSAALSGARSALATMKSIIGL
ncbi:conserved hypothetical protein [Microbacterium sp. 8M]|uniref:hypothetical protein n=1 Tax=Microbacterium sp. 8M TaxID=2653153 RepID=UPI0012F3A222|nr:hypothetical protein [Microbacterium sp. 8M]VXB12509.1 conserved hypothetical protein [Microbacterium sp. 8M]